MLVFYACRQLLGCEHTGEKRKYVFAFGFFCDLAVKVDLRRTVSKGKSALFFEILKDCAQGGVLPASCDFPLLAQGCQRNADEQQKQDECLDYFVHIRITFSSSMMRSSQSARKDNIVNIFSLGSLLIFSVMRLLRSMSPTVLTLTR